MSFISGGNGKDDKHSPSTAETKRKLKATPYLHYLKPAERGDPHHQFLIGDIFIKGVFVRTDLEEAARWFKLASEGGHTEAQFYLEVAEGKRSMQSMYEYEDRKKFKAEVIEATNGTSIEKYNVGRGYMEGKRVERNLEEAYGWLKLAADWGHMPAKELLGVWGFKCPRCQNLLPIRSIPCGNCGGSLEVVTRETSVPDYVDYIGVVHYKTITGPQYMRCTKCSNEYGWTSCKCGTNCSMSKNYGLHELSREAWIANRTKIG
ncbi:MAG: sel1 repeat family protein [Methanomassiliicoccaceae archaeon]|nr:sel1 repeat family protein [Methanomassiliicoccaceae archaeon]